MKKKVDSSVLNESCCIMNIPKTLSRADGSHLSNIFEDSKNSLRNTITPPQLILGSPSKIKCEQENSSDQSDSVNAASDKLSPPPSTLGPGAEIKGKICHPIPSSSGGIHLDELKPFDEIGRSASSENTSSGGRLAFFKEGKLLLELSHRTEQGSWVQVKSKTYWPPPSTTTTTTTIQHPHQQDTPTNHSDDGSSINSSPWASEHIRKQLGPSPRNKLWVSTDHLFYMKLTSHIRDLRKRVRLRRNPYNAIPTMLNFNIHNNSGKNCINSDVNAQHALVKDMKFIDRKKRLERTVSHLAKKLYFKLDDSISIHSLYEQGTSDACENAASSEMPPFITPRKRYLKTLETDIDSHLRKKAHSGSNLVSISGLSSPQLTKHCDNKLSFPSVSSPSSPLSLYAVPKSANGNNSQIASAYTIDSLLGSESSSEYSLQKNNSFLKTLLKHEKPLPSSSLSSLTKHGSALPVRDRGTPEASNRFHPLKRLEKDWEKGVISSPSPKEVYGSNETKATNSTESYDLSSSDLSSVVRFTSPHPFFNPYFDPRYIGFSPFSSTTPPPSSFLPGTTSQPSNDVASAVAVAAAAAAGYPITPLHLPGLTASLALGVYPPVTLTPPFIRSPNPSPSSPLSIPHSPSPKLSPATPALPRSPRFEIAPSSQDVWAPPVSSSHQKLPNTPSLSPPPQDVPLNLSKPKHNC